MDQRYQLLSRTDNRFSTICSDQRLLSDLSNDHNSELYKQTATFRIQRKPLPTSALPVELRSASSSHNALTDTDVVIRLVEEEETDNHRRQEQETRQRTSDGNDHKDALLTGRATPHWLPHTLRWTYMIGLLVFSLALLVTLIVLHVQSVKNNGIAAVNSTSIQFFGWRFVPTLLAVVYALLWTMLLEDVKRTEPFARLSKPNGVGASSSILQKPGAWWNALIDGFSTTKNQGSLSWALVCSAISVVIASLVISPFSSTFFVPNDFAIPVPTTFTRPHFSQQSPLQFGEQILPRFRTISNLLQNITTSAWVTDKFTVLPFHPAQNSTASLGAVVGTLPEAWEAETTVYSIALDCKPIHLVSRIVTNFTYSIVEADNQTYTGSSLGRLVNLATEEGCAIEFGPYLGWRFSRFGGSSWAPTGYIALPADDTGTPIGTLLRSITNGGTIQFSDQCSSDETILLSNAWTTDPSNTSTTTPWNPDLQFVGYACNTNYLAADVIVNVNITDSGSVITFNEEVFNITRKQVDGTAYNIAQFQDNFLTSNWTNHFIAPNNVDRISIGGPSAPLMATYNFSADTAITDSNFLDRALALKQRYFGEAMMLELSQYGEFSTKVDGKRIRVERRIFVAEPIAYTLETAMFMETLLILILYRLTRLSRRRLGLISDPARASTSARIIANNTDVQQCFKSIKHLDLKVMEQHFKGQNFYIEDQQLLMTKSATTEPAHHGKIPWYSITKFRRVNNKRRNTASSKNPRIQDWRPTTLYKRTIAGLALIMSLVLFAIAILFVYSRGPGLYQGAFVYTTQVSISGRRLSTIAPYSVIPTLLAVVIGLWWGAMETDWKFLQPFLVMSGKPTPLVDSMELSYRSSYLLWASVKAASRKHWLLSAICTGTLFSQIFTVGISALWQVQYGYRSSSITMSKDLELRVIPNSFPSFYIPGTHAWTPSDSARYALQDLYGSLQTNWLYSTIIQTSLGGPQPAWSADGWSFVPLDLLQIRIAETSTQEMNVTLSTPAIRGHLECSPVETLSNLSYWLTSQNFKNSSIWDNKTVPAELYTGYTLGCGTETGPLMLEPAVAEYSMCSGSLSTTFFAHDATLTCCENRTIGSVYGDAVIAYWSANSDNNDKSHNFTVKVLFGKPIGGVMMAENDPTPYLAWIEAPRAVALNCAPYIQNTNASVTVDRSTGRVRSYSILDEAKNDEYAWIDNWVMHTDPQAPYGQEAVNITASHGTVFMSAMFSAADLRDLVAGVEQMGYGGPGVYGENTNDTSFNFRQPGLNMDYMSYAMYSLANQDVEQLLDADKLAYYANKSFSAFFQNYVSSNMSLKDGGWAYQAIGATLPPLAISPQVVNLSYMLDQPRTVKATTSMRIEMLIMSPVAAWLCMCLLACLIVVAITLAILEKQCLAVMERGVSTMADILIMVAGSPALLAHYRLLSDDQTGFHIASVSNPKVKLGWFVDDSGCEKWGIELIGGETNVEWLDDESGGHNPSRLADVGNIQVTRGSVIDEMEAIPMMKLRNA